MHSPEGVSTIVCSKFVSLRNRNKVLDDCESGSWKSRSILLRAVLCHKCYNQLKEMNFDYKLAHDKWASDLGKDDVGVDNTKSLSWAATTGHYLLRQGLDPQRHRNVSVIPSWLYQDRVRKGTKMAQSPLNDPTQSMDSEEKGQSPTTNRRWLTEKKISNKMVQIVRS